MNTKIRVFFDNSDNCRLTTKLLLWFIITCPWPRGSKTFFMVNSTEHEFNLLIRKCQQNIIFTSISRMRNIFTFQHFHTVQPAALMTGY